MGGSGKKVKDPEKEKAKEAKSAEKQEKGQQEKQPKKAVKETIQYSLVRVSGTDLNGEKPLVLAIMGIKGVGWVMSKAVCEVSGFEPNKKLKDLDEKDVEKIEEIIKDPIKFGIPAFFVNRRNDPESGEDTHVSGADLRVRTKFDVQKYIDLKTYRGWRHMMGQPVRGQRTRSKFRQKGRVVGVIKKSVKITGQPAGDKGKDKK